MAWVDFITVAAAGYLLGAIPFAVIIARFCGVDIFKVGSGNPGATNVKRSCGKTAGNLCFILDASKGFAATAFPLYAHFFGIEFSEPQALAYVGLVAAIVGHSFSVFIKFRGGKGVAVTIGGLLAIMWAAILVALVLWVVVFYSTRYVSLASRESFSSDSTVGSLPALSCFTRRDTTLMRMLGSGIICCACLI